MAVPAGSDAPCMPCQRHAAARAPRKGGPGQAHMRAAGERPPRARPWRRGSPGPVPNPAVKPAVAESTAEEVRGRLGSRARGGRFSMRARRIGAKRARGGTSPAGPLRVYREIECPRTKATFRRYRSPGRFAHVAPDISLRPSATILFACLQPSISLIACACISHSTTICMRMRESPSTPRAYAGSQHVLCIGVAIHVVGVL